MSTTALRDLQAFHAGDGATFRALVRTESPRLQRLIRAYAVDADEAQELLQTTWVEAYRCREQFKGRGSVLGWLLAVCRTVCLQHVRRRGREPVAVPLEAIADHRGFEMEVHERELGAAIYEAIARLTPRERDAVVLRLVEGCDTRETASRMDCAEGTVKALLHRGTRKLRESLRHYQ